MRKKLSSYLIMITFQNLKVQLFEYISFFLASHVISDKIRGDFKLTVSVLIFCYKPKNKKHKPIIRPKIRLNTFIKTESRTV